MSLPTSWTRRAAAPTARPCSGGTRSKAGRACSGTEFATLQARVTRGAPSLFSDYGATDPGEFFAVISEVFFEQPEAMREEHPALYKELSQFYQLDPLSW